MRNLLTYSLLIFITLTFGGCMEVVTKNTAKSYNTWELCTLRYRPHQIYPDWIDDEEENKTIETELEKRGIYNENSCDIVELAKRQCLEFGYKKDTKDFIDCTSKSFKDINDHILASRQNRGEEQAQASKAFTDGWNSGLLINNQQQPQSTFKTCTTSVLTGRVSCY